MDLVLKLAKATLVLVFLVIIAGAVVRATGAGMGCPDWPKCFGKLIPPTDSLSLPKGYRQLYVEKRKAKNERMARVLRVLGADDLAEKMLNDPAIYSELDFNVEKAWIEYVNRLCGVLLGFVQFALVIAAWIFRKEKRRIFFYSLLALLLTVFEGWLGSIVVSTNLLPGTITLHMFLALGIMALMIAIIGKIKNDDRQLVPAHVKNILLIAIFFSIVQIIMGTQVREQVDSIATRIDNRSEWIEQLNGWFPVHRLIAIAVLLLNVLLFVRLRHSAVIKNALNYLLIVIIAEILAGATLSFFSFPVFVQPVHLLLAVLMFALQVYIFYKIRKQTAI